MDSSHHLAAINLVSPQVCRPSTVSHLHLMSLSFLSIIRYECLWSCVFPVSVDFSQKDWENKFAPWRLTRPCEDETKVALKLVSQGTVICSLCSIVSIFFKFRLECLSLHESDFCKRIVLVCGTSNYSSTSSRLRLQEMIKIFTLGFWKWQGTKWWNHQIIIMPLKHACTTGSMGSRGLWL